ncbi:heat shock protein HtpX [Nonomuraea fuscirosea]|uniref:Heat shock protein HtpX n=1 Tax=Nonomuraea fuscirosea TaxID=1291556 RepID=A0A2T0MKU5_9ACTN|nr:M48 family metalloprotease [Nonomuraea fuscirosea]PRX58240.1 heat shock protein HtpX [Nonomuraea fuscirosea]
MARRSAQELVPRMIVAMALLALVYAVPIVLALMGGVTVPVVVTVVALAVLPQWWATEWMARKATRARIVSPEEQPELHAVLDRLCALNDLPKPRVAVSRDPRPNAFTLGRSRRHTTVMVTQGLLDALEPEELTVAMAHEVAHIRHRDVAFMTLAGSLTIAMAWGMRVAGRFARRHSRPVPFLRQVRDLPAMFFLASFASWIALLWVLSVLARLPLRALSRSRELAADHDAALQTGQPALLAATLLKISGCGAIPRTDLRAATIPAVGLVSTEPARYGWWSSHPRITERVDRLT